MRIKMQQFAILKTKKKKKEKGNMLPALKKMENSMRK